MTCATVVAQSKVTCVELRSRAQPRHTCMVCRMHSPPPAKRPVCLPAALALGKAGDYYSRCDNDGLDGCAAYDLRLDSTQLRSSTGTSSVLYKRSTRYMLIKELFGC